MTRPHQRLDTAAIQNLTPLADAKGPKLYADGGGLYLQITPAGIKSWLYRGTLDGTPYIAGLGALHTVSLEEARADARALRKALKSGVDPRASAQVYAKERKAGLARTFKVCAEELIATLKNQHKSAKAHAQWMSTFERYVYPTIGATPVAQVNVHMIRKILTQDDLWVKKHSTMSRVRGRIERVLGYAAVMGWRSVDNPARFSNFLSEVLPKRHGSMKVAHHPALSYQELPPFMEMLRSQPASMSSLALEFLILTACRTNEVIGARWSEIDADGSTFIVPAARMKAGKEFRVPLSKTAQAVVERLRQWSNSEFLFPGAKFKKPLSNMALLQYMRGLEEKGLLVQHVVPHGMRATFRMFMAEQTDFSRELAELSLAHSLPSKVEASYQRADLLEKRRLVMEHWASYCAGEIPLRE